MRLCIYEVEDLTNEMLPKCDLIDRPASRSDLLNGLTALQFDVVIVDLDKPNALNTIMWVAELRSSTGIIAITGQTDINRIIEAQRAGCGQIVTRPIDPNDLQVAVTAFASARPARGRANTFALFGATGGAGTTTLASHLATETAALTDADVGVIDLDLDFGGVARAFDLVPKYTVTDIASAGVVDRSVLRQACGSVGKNVHVLARPNAVGEAAGLDREAVLAMLDASDAAFKHVIIDLPRKLDEITGAAMEHATKLLIVLQLTVPSIENARRLITALTELGFDIERLELVVNRFRKNVHDCTLEMVEHQCGKPVFAVVPNDYQAVRESLDVGKPLAGRNPVRAAIRQLSEKLLGISDEQRGRWFSPFRKRVGTT